MSPPDQPQEKPAAAIGAEDLRAWMDRYGPPLRRYFRRKVTAAEAEELVQEVFLALHTRAASTPIENMQAYLFRIAAHLLAKRRDIDPAGDLKFEDWDGQDVLSPERALITKQELARLLVAIRNLPPRAREAFVFHKFEEMTYAAIAKRMRISLSAVRQLIARAATQVAKEMGRAP